LSTTPPPQTADAVGRSAMRRINRRLLPFLFLLYIVAYLDRVNVGFAKLEMTGDLKFNDDIFGFGSGIFFLGYVLLEIPGTILVEIWSARKWIARIMISWGLVAALTGLVHTKQQFYWARFLLGVAEAGFFPGVIVYLTHWYRAADRAKAIAMFMSAIPLSYVVGAPISAGLMKIHGLGLHGWQWLLILEGAPAIVLGIVTLFYLTDRPQQAKWLPDREREWIIGELAREKLAAAAGTQSVWRALSNPNVLLLMLAYFCGATVQYGFGLWLPAILKKLSGFTTTQSTLITAIPYVAALPAMLLVGWNSDRTGERRWHTSICLAVSGLALLATQYTAGNVVLGVAMFSIAAMGINGRLSAFWPMPSAFLGGTAAAAAIGLINCIGNTGGFVGPHIVGYLSTKFGSYAGGVAFLIGSAFVGAAAVLMVRKTDERKSERVTLVV
jgi:ACS family tartrate transporter-like MFS transporter